MKVLNLPSLAFLSTKAPRIPSHASIHYNYLSRRSRVHRKPTLPTSVHTNIVRRSSQSLNELEGWSPLSPEGGYALKKQILNEGTGECIPLGSDVKVEYVGTLAGEDHWTVDDVECWLKNLQGLDQLAQSFRDNGVDGKILLDSTIFTEDFVSQTLGVSNRIQCKKLVMAAKRLSKQQLDFPAGMEFDSSAARGRSFEFRLGAGKAIKAYEIAISTMRLGERAKVIARADFCYGADGYRTREGQVVVPPFATLEFDLTVLSAEVA